MVSRIAISTFFALVLQASAQLNLTPRTHVSELEGAREEITAFRNGSSLVTWQSPRNWRISGGARRITLIPPDTTQADASVEITGPPGSDTFDEVFAKKLRQEVAISIGREATDIEWADDEVSPLMLNRHPTYKVMLSYTLGAQRFTTTVLLCNFAEQQIRFRLTARAKDFTKLHGIFRESLYTWQGLN